MASLREIRRKIKSVKSTQQITKAMKMVAAARMRRAQSSILSARPFAVKMEDMIRDLALVEIAAAKQEGREAQLHPFFQAREGRKVGLVLVTADKGLCGAFNGNLLRFTAGWLREHRDDEVTVFAVGRKGRDFLRRVKTLTLASQMAGVFPKINFAHAELLGKEIIDAYVEKGLSRVVVVYNEFKSVVVQRIVVKDLLPLPMPAADPTRVPISEQFLFEPDQEGLLRALLPRYLKAQLYRILLESQAAELAARMNAMDAASKNAGELIGAMTLSMNRTRQAMITKEIAELVGGAEALAQ